MKNGVNNPVLNPPHQSKSSSKVFWVPGTLLFLLFDLFVFPVSFNNMYYGENPMKMNPVVHFRMPNAMRKLIVSTFATLDGVMKAIRSLKEQKGPEIQVHGIGNLIQTLLKHDLFGGGTQPAGLKTGSFGLDNPSEAEIERRKRLADEAKSRKT